MKSKKLISAILAGAMALSIAGCSSTSKKYEKALKDLDYEVMEEFDQDDVEDDIEDGLILTTKDEKDIKKICKDSYLDGVKAKNVASIFFGGRVEDGSMFVVYSITFKDKDSAAKTFDNFIEGLEDQEDRFKDWYGKDAVKSDSDDDYFAMALEEYSDFNYYEIFMDDSKTITMVIAVITDDDDIYDEYQDFYEAIDRDCPVDLLKDHP